MDDAELIEQTLIFDALEWPQQAHMMSAPTERSGQGILDDSGEPAPDPLQWHVEIIAALTVERDALRAEVEKWKEVAAQEHFRYLDTCTTIVRMSDEIERLRKDQHATVDTKPIRSETGMAQTLMRAGRAGAADMVLDPRLGMPQPDGEPVEPMAGRKPYRWGHL